MIGRHVSVSLVDVSDVAIEGALGAHVRALAAAAAGLFCGRPVMAPKKLSAGLDAGSQRILVDCGEGMQRQLLRFASLDGSVSNAGMVSHGQSLAFGN